jgi:hypothetical protein
MVISPEEAFKALKDMDLTYDTKSLKTGYIGTMATDENGEPIIKLYTTDGV